MRTRLVVSLVALNVAVLAVLAFVVLAPLSGSHADAATENNWHYMVVSDGNHAETFLTSISADCNVTMTYDGSLILFAYACPNAE